MQNEAVNIDDTQKQPKSAIAIWFGLFFINYDVGADFAHQ